MTIPDGYVDPTDPQQVGEVIAAAFSNDGPPGVFDLLRRLPGAQVRGGTAAGFLKHAEPPTILLGDEHTFVLSESALEHGHVVRGVVLQRERLQGVRLADSLSQVIARYVRDTGQLLDASATLTAIRDLSNPT